MPNQSLGFDADFKEEICIRNKEGTLRYKEPHRLPSEGDVVDAVISHDRGPFARLRITKVYPMTVDEVIATDFDSHQNYQSLQEFNERMDQYYEKEFTLNDELYMIEFELVEVL